jgi:hypothetical protein
MGRSLDRCGRFGTVSSALSSRVDQQAAKPDSTTRPRCARMRIEMEMDGPRVLSRDSASGSQKATLRLTNEPLGAVGVSSPRHLMPSIRLHGPRTQSSYMTSRNALRHVLARTTPSPARRSPRTSQRVYIVFLFRPKCAPDQSPTRSRWMIMYL